MNKTELTEALTKLEVAFEPTMTNPVLEKLLKENTPAPKAEEEEEVVSPETKKLLEEQEKTDALNALRHEQNIEAEKAEKKEQEEASATTMEKYEASKAPVHKKTKAEFKALIEAYKLQNPVKYEGKKEALERELNSL